MVLRPRLGALIALAVPVLPLGNLAAGAAVAYVVTIATLAVAFRIAHPAVRRGLLAATATVAGFVAAGVGAPIAGATDAVTTARTIAEALPITAYGLAAVAAFVATAFPMARSYGRWGAAVLGAVIAAAAAAPALPAAPLLVAAWLLCIPLWLLEPEH
jgi:hypothetical protein